VVQVKGYPLGEFHATNIGKVVSPYERDTQGARSHDDFIVDALLTSGGSGSPVFAVSCKTGEFELVGIFHARYVRASALNVVVAIDQVRDLMTTPSATPRRRSST
jgi:serine protease Do